MTRSKPQSTNTIIKLRRENADKDAEIAQLRAENTRLKQERMAMRLPGPRSKKEG